MPTCPHCPRARWLAGSAGWLAPQARGGFADGSVTCATRCPKAVADPCALVAPPCNKQPNHPPLTLDVYAPPSLRLTSTSWGHFTFYHRTACLLSPACLPCPALPYLSLPLPLPFPSLLYYYYCYIVIIRLHSAASPPSLPGLSRPAATTVPESHNQLLPRFPICTPIPPPRPDVCHFVAGQIRPLFIYFIPPWLVRPRVPVTGRASKHVTYPSSIFFLPSPPLPLSSSLLLWICWHIDQPRDFSFLAGICVLWLASLLTIPPTYTDTHPHPTIHCQATKQACLPACTTGTPTWPPPTAIDHRPRLPVSSQQLPWEQPSQTLTTYHHAQFQQLPLPRMAHIPPGHPLAATRPAPPPAATPQPASSPPPETQHSTWPLRRMCGTRQGTLVWLAGPSLGREVT